MVKIRQLSAVAPSSTLLSWFVLSGSKVETKKPTKTMGNRIWHVWHGSPDPQSILTMTVDGLQFRTPGPFRGRFRSYGVAWKLPFTVPAAMRPRGWAHPPAVLAAKDLRRTCETERAIYHHLNLSSSIILCMKLYEWDFISSWVITLYDLIFFLPHVPHVTEMTEITDCRRRRTSSPARHHRLRRPVRTPQLYVKVMDL